MENIKQKYKKVVKYLSILLNKSLFNKSLFNKSLFKVFGKRKIAFNPFVKINFSFSSDISYEILPSPHFSVKNAKIYTNDADKTKQISEIKELKIFISQNNFFNKEKLEVNPTAEACFLKSFAHIE